MTGVGAAATADAHALGPVSTRSATSSAIYSTQCLGCDREGGCGHYPTNVARRPIGCLAPIPTVHATIAQPPEPTPQRSLAAPDGFGRGMPKGGHCKAAPAVGGTRSPVQHRVTPDRRNAVRSIGDHSDEPGVNWAGI